MYSVQAEECPGGLKGGMHGALCHSVSHTSIYRGLN